MELVVIHVFHVLKPIYTFAVLQLLLFLFFSLGLSTPWTNGTTASVSNGNKETNNSPSSPKWIGARGKRPCPSGGRSQTRVLHESQKLARYQQYASDISHTVERSMAEWLYCEQTLHVRKQGTLTTDLKKRRLDRASYCSRSHKIEASGANLLGPLSPWSLLYVMAKITFKKNVSSSLFNRITFRTRVASKLFSSQCKHVW